MAAYAYDDFRLAFTRGASGAYDVVARAANEEEVTGSFVVPLSADELENAVRSLGRSRSSSRDATVEVDVHDEAEKFGTAIAGALLTGPVGDLFERSFKVARDHERGVRLTLSLGETPELLSVPWEFLYRRRTFLASQRKSPVVRYLETGEPPPPRRIEGAVRMLGVVASPSDLTPLKVDEERARVERALEKVGDLVELSWCDPATPRKLRQMLQESSYDILHFVGHSDFTPNGDGVLFLEDDTGKKAVVTEAVLTNLLGDQDSLRLAIFNSCKGARTTSTDPFAGIATSLVSLGVPAVVAMQFSISDDAAIYFAEELFTSLIARQDPIDAAVSEARKAVFTEVNQTEWATPVLFLNAPDGRLFDFARPPAIVAPVGDRTEPQPLVTPPPPPPGPTRKRPRWLVPVAAVAAVIVAIAALVWLRPDGGGGETTQTTTTATTTAPPGCTGDDLCVGVNSAAVQTVEENLQTLGYDPGTVDTVYDERTRDAIATFQVSERLNDPKTVRGVVGEQTRAALVLPPGSRPDRFLVVATDADDDDQHVHSVAPAGGKANEETSRPGAIDTNPSWHPTFSVLTFDRQESGATRAIHYSVAGDPQRLELGGKVVDELLEPTGSGDRQPVWAPDGSLYFVRSECRPDCGESIYRAEVEFVGKVVSVVGVPARMSGPYAEVRSLAVHPQASDRYVVATGDGVLVVDSGTEELLEGSDGATRALFGADPANIVALRGAFRAGFGDEVLEWVGGSGAPSTRTVGGEVSALLRIPDGSGYLALLDQSGTDQPLTVVRFGSEAEQARVLTVDQKNVEQANVVALGW